MAEWDREVDVVVVGFGGAGSCAAIEARSEGAEVLVIERFQGGGATARSGGVVYLGGGSFPQQQAGYNDDPEQMFRYLRLEVGDVVDEATLQRFCDDSVEQLAWLEALGVPFPVSAAPPTKTSYPTSDCTLYFSGNELAAPFSAAARPAPRGHRTAGKGSTGQVLFGHLRRATQESGAEVLTYSRGERLITRPDGSVDGIEIARFAAPWFARRLHAWRFAVGSMGALLSPRLGTRAQARLRRLEARYHRPLRVRARGGVVLCTGGFVFNREMVEHYAPRYAAARPLGTLGDDGSGIALGQSVGGAVDHMDHCSAWRFINPPSAFTQGMLVNRHGERVCNEELYGGTLGQQLADHPGGAGYLVIDADLHRRALREIRSGKTDSFQTFSGLINLFRNRVKARTVAELGALCGMPKGALEIALEKYNAAVENGGPDAFGKSRSLLRTLRTSPFYAIDVGLESRSFPAPSITLGGLRVEALTGRVLDEGGRVIPGLYAAGRAAVGVASRSYVSGLAISDCVFSGRNAGRHAARGANSPPVAFGSPTTNPAGADT